MPNLVQVRECSTGAYVLWFEAQSVFLVNPHCFFADGKKYQTGMEVYIEIIKDDGEPERLGQQSVVSPLLETQQI